MSRTASCLMILVAVLLISAAPKEGVSDEAGERQKLAGLWKGFAVQGKGEQPDRGPVKLELTFTDKTIHGIQITSDDRIDHGTGDYLLNLSADPHHLDGVRTNERGRKDEWLGIYSLEGDTLRWCVGRNQRPDRFETVKGQFLLILKREK